MTRRNSLGSVAVALLLACSAQLAGPVAAAGPDGQMTWAGHISLAPTWFDPAETPGIAPRSWCSTRCTTRS
jgi:peptide/nickel transport system substrate-binding protein